MFSELSRLSLLSLVTLSLILSSCASSDAPPAPEGTTPTNAPAAGGAADLSGQAGQGQPGAQSTLEAQRRSFMIEQYVRQAKALVSQSRLQEAEVALLQAQQLDPDRAEVRELLSDVQTQLGRRAGDVTSYGERMAQLNEVKEQKARSDAQMKLEAGKKAMEAGDFGTAIQNFRQVVIQVEAGPSIAWGSVPTEAKALLAQAEKDRDSREAAQRAAAEKDAFDRLKQEEELREARRRDSVRRLMAKAVKAFEDRRFGDTREYCDEVLRLDSVNEQARELHAASEKGLRDTRHEDYYRRKAEDMRRWEERNLELKTPYTDIMTAPDMDHWRKLERLRQTAGATGQGELLDEAARKIDADLRKIPVGRLAYTEENGAFDQVVKDLSTITSIPILVTPAAKEAITADGTKIVLTLQHPVSVRNFLDIITTKFSDKLGWFIRDGAVFIGTKSESLGDKVVRPHDIQDLVFGITNFAGPKIREIPVEGQQQAGADAEVPRQGGIVGEAFKFVDPEQLVAAIKETIAKETWADPGFKIEPVHGNLLVIHTPEVHAKIAQFLDDLRRFHSHVVSIESKFLSVSRNWLQEFGVDIRGLGGPSQQGTVAQLDDITNGLDDNASRGLDNAGTGDVAGHPASGAFFNDGGDGDIRARTENYFLNPLGKALSTTGGATIGLTILDDTELNIIIRAVEKSTQVQVVNSQLLTVMNDQRANISVVNLTSYVRDFGVEVAQASFIADPQVDVIQDGVVLDVRPVISHDRKYITMDLQPTVAELKRPIPTFTSSLAGATLPVTIQLPQMTVRSASTTVKVPDGGSVLIGGLREILNRDRRAEVPWIARLPIVGILFKQEGSADENQSLMVLVRAQVTDVKDFMKQLSRR